MLYLGIFVDSSIFIAHMMTKATFSKMINIWKVVITALLFYFVLSSLSFAIVEPLFDSTQQMEWTDAELEQKIRNIRRKNPKANPRGD